MAPIRPLLRFASLALISACLAPVALAQLPSARLDTIFPAGGKAGSEFEVKIRGADLDDLERIRFSHAGITAAAKPLAEGEQKDVKKAMGEADFIVKIASDVPAGNYEARVVGRFGMSNSRIFAVGTQEELREAGGNNSAESAMEITLGQLANGVCDKDAVDYFKFNATAGQKITFDCQAQRIDSKMDATLALLDAAGKELAIARDTTGLDAVLTTNIAADGTYTLAVYDFTYEGGPEYFYRLSMHDGARVDFVFPPVVEAGTSAKVTAYGQNLPGGQAAEGMNEAEPMQQVTVDVSLPADDAARQDLAFATDMPPAGAGLDAQQVDVAPATKAVVAFASTPVIVEQEPNSEATQAQSVTLPCEYVGRFYPQGDRDWLTFTAKAGDVLWLEVISQQMGSPADPMLVIEQVTTNDKGEQSAKQIAEVDDAGPANAADVISLGTKDPTYRLEVKEDATYRVLIYDLYDNSAADPKSVYRLAIRPLAPDFRLVAYAAPGGDQNEKEVSSTILRRGGSSAVELKVIRRDGFDGEIDITAEGLPAGVSCPPVTIAPGETDARVMLFAEEGAAPASGTFALVGRANVNDKELLRRARAGSLVWGTANAQQDAPVARLTSDLAVAVIDDMVAPASVTLGSSDMIELKIGEKVDVPVKVARFGEFKGPLKLNAIGLPKEIKVNEVNITGDDATINIDLTNAKMKEGTYTVHLQGATKVKYQRVGEDKPKDVDVAVLSTPVRIRVAAKEEPPK